MGSSGCKLHACKMRWVAQGRAPADDERAGVLRIAHGFAVHSQQQVPGCLRVRCALHGAQSAGLHHGHCTWGSTCSSPQAIAEPPGSNFAITRREGSNWIPTPAGGASAVPFTAWARGTGEDWFRIGEGCPMPRGCRALLLMGRAGDGAV